MTREGALGAVVTAGLHLAALVALAATDVGREARAHPPALEWIALATPADIEPQIEPAPTVPAATEIGASEPDASGPAVPAPPRRAAPPRVVTAEAARSTGAVAAEAPSLPVFADLTGLVLAGEPGGSARGSGHPGASTGAGSGPTPAEPARAVLSAIVPASDLSRPPVPPDLTDALHRHLPPRVRDRGQEGSALVIVRIGPSGEVLRPRVVGASFPELGEACAAALRASRWSEPLDREGHRVTTLVRYRCELRVR